MTQKAADELLGVLEEQDFSLPHGVTYGVKVGENPQTLVVFAESNDALQHTKQWLEVSEAIETVPNTFMFEEVEYDVDVERVPSS